jgi:ATP-dependent DNA ligase
MGSLCVKFNEEKVHAMYPEASMVPAMEIWSLPKNKKDRLEEYCDSGKYLASLKLDGYFYSFNKTPNYSYLFSRKPGVNGLLTEKADRVPHIIELMQVLPPDTLIVGEIYIPGKTSKDVTRIMGSLAKKAIDRQNQEGKVHYYINDIIMLNGKDLRDKTFSERILVLENLYRLHFKDSEYIDFAWQVEEDIYKTAMDYLDAGEEGMVLKKKDALYACDKRPAWSSIKIKQEDTLDVVITGFCDPTMRYNGTELNDWKYWWIDNLEIQKPLPLEQTHGEPFLEGCNYGFYFPVTKAYYYGWKMAMEISAYNKEGSLVQIGTISSGLTDELREAFAKTPEKYLNKVVEITCMSLDSEKKSVRHGRLIKFREDKNPEDCTLDLIFR